MKPTVLFLTVLGCVAASPSGYYHQEYNYKTSAASYRNNELQHKTDDQGYFKKDGDLEGRVRPRIDANSEHSEYVNPNLKAGGYNTGLVGGANGDMSSFGHMRAEAGSYGSHDASSEGLAHADHIVGSRGAYSGYNSGSYGSNYASSSQSYGASSNLRSLTYQLQQDLERDLQRAIQENRAYSQSLSVTDLERELRQNLTNRLNAELANRYGQQSIRGGLSYTISGGRLHSTANYDNQELQDLRTQIENALLNQLRTQYSQSSRYESHQSSHNNYGYSTTVRPVYYTHALPYRPASTIRPSYPSDYTQNTYIYTPVANPESITTIASSVQNQLDTRLNELLEEAQRRYFSSGSSYSVVNVDLILENLRNELRNNITYLLNENVKANYGNQIPKDGYMYSIGTNGQTSSQYNYAIKDLENLRSQIERNLIEKLNRDFERYRARWYQQSSSYSQSSQNSGNVHYGSYSTPRYEVYNSYSTPRYESDVEHFSTRPSSSHISALINNGGSSSNRHYNLLAGSNQAGYEISGSGSSSISQLQRQLQQDLSRQLQAAISRGHYGSYSTSGSGSYNPQGYQTSLQQLTDELNRNLTRQLQEYSSSAYYSTYGNVDQAQMANLRNQLQADLQRQLQQGLQQSYHSSQSYSASSSSSSNSNANYRPVRGFENYQLGQYRSGGNVLSMNGADCVGDGPNAYNSRRMKRSYQPYRSQPIGLGYSGSHRYNSYTPYYGHSGSHTHAGGRYGSSSYGEHPQQELSQSQTIEELGQQVDDSDLTQQVENSRFETLQGQQQGQLGQQFDDSDLTQQVEDPNFGKLEPDSQRQQQVDDSDLTQQVQDTHFGRWRLRLQGQQQTDDSDLTQQSEDLHFGKLQTGQQTALSQQVDDSDLTQQTQDSNFGRFQLGSQGQQQVSLGQQVDDSDLTQQTQDSNFGKLQLESQGQHQIGVGQQVDDSDLTQQTQDSNFGKLQLGSQGQHQIDVGRQVDDADLTQQTQDSHFGRLQFGSQGQQQFGLGQQVHNSDLTEQTQDSNFGRLQLGSQGQHQIGVGQQVDDSQQTHGSNFGRSQLGSQGQQQVSLGQQVDDSDLTQQTQDSNFGKLQLGSQEQHQIGVGQQVDDVDLTQQTQDANFGRLQLGSQGQQQVSLGQQIDDSDLTQQTQDSNFGRLQLGSEGQQQVSLGQQVDDSELTQQIQDSNFGRLQLGSQGQQQVSLGQEDDSDLTQQTQDSNFGRWQLGSQGQQQVSLGQQVDDSDLSQQTQYSNFGRLQLGSQGQHQIGVGQPVDDSDLTQQTQDSNFERLQLGSQGQHQIGVGQQVDDSDLTQQTQDSNFGRLQLGSNGQQQVSLGQQVDDSDLTQQTQDSNFGRLQLGSHGQQQVSLSQQVDDSDLTLQTQDSNFGKLQLGSQGQHQVGLGQQVDNTDLTQQIEQSANEPDSLTNQEIDRNHRHRHNFNRQQFSGNLQFGHYRPISQRPINNNNFIQTEIAHQQQLYPYHGPENKPSDLPTLNKVIQTQLNTPEFEESNTDLATGIATPENNSHQQIGNTVDEQQQQNIDSFPQNSIDRDNLNKQISVNNVGQTEQSQSLAEAEREADLLIQALREAQKNQVRSTTNRPLSYAQVARQGNSGSYNQVSHGSGSHIYQSQSLGPIQHTKSFENSYKLYLNDRQIQLAQQLENDLAKQLEDAISQKYYTIIHTGAGSEGSYQTNYEKLSNELQRNITKQLEETFRQTGQSGHSVYSNNVFGSITEDQREKLIRDLQADLSRQLQQNLQMSYGLETNRQNSLNTRVIYSSSGNTGHGPNNHGEGHITHHFHYGHQGVVANSETVSELEPIEPKQPTIVHNIEPQVPNYNSGVKGSGRSSFNSPVVPSAQVPGIPQPSDVVPPEPIQVVEPQLVNPGSKTQEIIDTEVVTEQNLPWWKRFGNKVKQGATTLKEKIIG